MKTITRYIGYKWRRLTVLILFLGFYPTIQAQVGIDFNHGDNSGSVNLTSLYRMYHPLGDIIPEEGQNSINIGLNGFFWLSHKLSTRFTLGLGLPLLTPKELNSISSAKNSNYFYEGLFALRITLLKANIIAIVLGILIDSSEGHTGDIFLFSPNAASTYLQTSLGIEFEMVFALGLEYLFYLRLNVPMSTYNYLNNKDLEWGFYPRQGSLELAFLFHKGPSFGLSKAARNVYFGPFYRFDARILSLTPPSLILSHSIGVTYYVKPPF